MGRVRWSQQTKWNESGIDENEQQIQQRQGKQTLFQNKSTEWVGSVSLWF